MDTKLRLRGRVQMIWVDDALLLSLGATRVRVAPFTDKELAELHELRSGFTADQVAGVPWMSRLYGAGFLEECASASSDPDLARFDRLLHFLSEMELSGESRFTLLRRLHDAHCVIVGLGGLASWVVYNLLCCGVGRFTVIDGDVVEMSNLNRSILFSEADVGRPKVTVAAEAMRRFYPSIEVTTRQLTVTCQEELLPEFDGADLVLSLADQPPWVIKEWITAAAQRTKTPALLANGSRVGPFRREESDACAMCDWSHQMERQPLYGDLLRRQIRLPRGSSGALSPYGSMTGGFVAMEAVRHLLGLEPATLNRVWRLASDFTAGFDPCAKNPRCGVCGTAGEQALPLPSRSLEGL
ncbi:ThiF family adenylyltransferase [Nonomuraea angiospora]|uniref:HesA/MoeB/ThiF family protein n=1 Tax=Nonomuraea angiospora TaxID=46172 RepID=UPI0034290475